MEKPMKSISSTQFCKNIEKMRAAYLLVEI